MTQKKNIQNQKTEHKGPTKGYKKSGSQDPKLVAREL